MKVIGDKALEKKLRALPKKLQRKIEPKAMRAGLKVIEKVAKAAVPFPHFRKAIGSRYRAKDGGKVGANVGKKGGRRVPHLNLWITGSRNRRTALGHNRGSTDPNPVINEAESIAGRQAVETITSVMRQEIEKQ